MNYYDYQFTKMDWLWIAAMYCSGSILVGYLFFDSLIPMIIGIPLIYLLAKKRKAYCIQKRLESLRKEFKSFMASMASALNAGYALENTFMVIREDLLMENSGRETSLSMECLQMQRKMEMKQPIEQLMLDLGERSGLQEIREFAQVIVIAKRSGGNMIQIIRDTTNQMDQCMQVEQEIGIMISAKKMEQTIMLCVPFGMILYLRMSNPGYLDCMYSSLFGRLAMLVCLIGIWCSYIWARKIIDISV